MKLLMTLVALGLVVAHAYSASNVESAESSSYAANLGWLNWRGDGPNGAVVGPAVCSGYVYAANSGWIHLGNGSPANGSHYQNNSAADYGVNLDSAGNLRGSAWGANLGWINFESVGAPRVDFTTGQLTGYAYSANAGWIGLTNVRVSLTMPLADADADGLPDDWELSHAGNLNDLTASGDHDKDGSPDRDEFLAGTDPTDPSSLLRILAIAVNRLTSTVTLTWSSQPTRLYQILKCDELASASPWTSPVPGLIQPSPGTSTTHSFVNALKDHEFYRIKAVLPPGPGQ
jgi:hypothetical protein